MYFFPQGLFVAISLIFMQDVLKLNIVSFLLHSGINVSVCRTLIKNSIPVYKLPSTKYSTLQDLAQPAHLWAFFLLALVLAVCFVFFTHNCLSMLLLNYKFHLLSKIPQH